MIRIAAKQLAHNDQPLLVLRDQRLFLLLVVACEAFNDPTVVLRPLLMCVELVK
jgi:hypothetical protein